MDRDGLRTVDGPTVAGGLAGDDMTVRAKASQRRPRQHAAEALGALRNLLTTPRRFRLGHLSSMADRAVVWRRPQEAVDNGSGPNRLEFRPLAPASVGHTRRTSLG